MPVPIINVEKGLHFHTPCKATASPSGAVGVRGAQGHLDTWLGGAGDWTSNPPVPRQLLYPPDPPPFHVFTPTITPLMIKAYPFFPREHHHSRRTFTCRWGREGLLLAPVVPTIGVLAGPRAEAGRVAPHPGLGLGVRRCGDITLLTHVAWLGLSLSSHAQKKHKYNLWIEKK